jgi:hypothetical protein
MVTDKNGEPRSVNTGGGAYVGGNVNVGGDFVGRDQVKQIQVTSGITVDQFRDLVAQIRREVRKAGLEPGDAEIVDAEVTVIEEEAAKERPDRTIVVSRLKKIGEVLGAAASVATIATASGQLPQVVETIKTAIHWAQQLF